jgi:hypothetical protein
VGDDEDGAADHGLLQRRLHQRLALYTTQTDQTQSSSQQHPNHHHNNNSNNSVVQ